MVESPKGIELLQSSDEHFRRGRVHEVKVNQVRYTEALQQQHNITQVGTLDLRQEETKMEEGRRGVEEKVKIRRERDIEIKME